VEISTTPHREGFHRPLVAETLDEDDGARLDGLSDG
jgi:hypothetical protein